MRDVIEAATAVFIQNGYSRTQMADIAQALGLGKGTLYGYVEGKEALFFLAAAYADRRGPDSLSAALPIANPAPGELLALFGERVANALDAPVLRAALARERAPDIRSEFSAVVREAYATLARNRHGIKLLDRCAPEIPELRDAWSNAGRDHELATLERYIELRAETGQLLALPDVGIAARMLLETLTTWAVHIHWDRNPRSYDPERVEATLVALLVRAFVAP